MPASLLSVIRCNVSNNGRLASSGCAPQIDAAFDTDGDTPACDIQSLAVFTTPDDHRIPRFTRIEASAYRLLWPVIRGSDRGAPRKRIVSASLIHVNNPAHDDALNGHTIGYAFEVV
jgi:hypothetical protein